MPLTLEELRAIEKSAAKLAKEIAKVAAEHHGNEQGFRRQFANLIDDVAEAHGITLSLREEYTVATGRADAVYNRFVIEYEPPGSLRKSRSNRHTRHAVQQVQDYIEGVSQEERQKIHRLAGVATDGYYYVFVRHVDEHWLIEDPIEVNAHSTAYFLRLLFSLTSGRALIPRNLIDDFGSGNLAAQQCARALYQALEGNPPKLVGKIFEQWQTFFGEVTGYEEGSDRLRDKKELQAFAKGMGLDPKKTNPPKLFFSVHTYFAILIKFIAWLALSRFVSSFGTNFASLQNLSGSDLQRRLRQMEEGGIFSTLGIRNFLEGDFFGWYLITWNRHVENAIRVLLQRLSDYDPGTLEVSPEQTRDLLKRLYHYLMPRELRHDLGEYYTPDWLAQRLLNQLDGGEFKGDPKKRLIDPACGSGTFLVLAINAMKGRCRQSGYNEALTLEAILNNIVGIDLNPLAVIAARTNYLLALGDLLEHRNTEINIPIYMADSIVPPARGRELFDQDKYAIHTTVGNFEVPGCIDSRPKIERLANLLHECVKSETSPQAFLERANAALQEAVSKSEWSNSKEDFTALYQRLLDLHKEGLNGIWARIIKNAFMPLYLGDFDYVAGNPPWVNWESLPEEYRRRTFQYWDAHNLFPHKGYDAILGKSKDDISVLMTYQVMDRFLKKNGRLGFIITQSVFKTAGAGQGFRRFTLGDKTPIAPVFVDDMSEMQVFEEATNRTAVVILRKGQKAKYPVPYTYWQKTVKGKRISFDASIEEAQTMTRRVEMKAEPVDTKDLTSAWLSAPPKALKAIRKVLGKSEYQARAGIYSGGANGVYWVEKIGERPDGLWIIRNLTERTKRKVEEVTAEIEPDLLYPLLRGRDVRRWKAMSSCYIITTHLPGMKLNAIPEVEMQSQYPKAYQYLKRFEKTLRSRAAYKRYFQSSDPFYSMFNVGDYTFSPHKVVWAGIASDIKANAISSIDDRIVLPEHVHVFVGMESSYAAHYAAAAMNSTPFRAGAIAYSQVGGKSFATPHILEYLNLPIYVPGNEAHKYLVKLSKQAHEAAAKEELNKLKEVEARIDEEACSLWGITEDELKDLQAYLSDLQGKGNVSKEDTSEESAE